MVKIGIVGSRTRNSEEDFKNTEKTFLRLRKSHPNCVIVSGGATTGGDRFAILLGAKYNTRVINFYPKGKYIGNTRYYVRNCRIARVSNYLIACWDGRSKGTKITIDKFNYYLAHPSHLDPRKKALYIV